ncbi:MAG: DUF1501 domain-containing protein [Planctomycetaceae bacterium]|nr:DUF1501 domain-containing protein [Planctomycetaceae bacterium]
MNHLKNTRRSALQLGTLSALGLSLGQMLRAETRAPAKETPPCESVIQIYLPGGIAHQELVDPKPAAPVEYRGEMDSIETSIPGVRFNELMKETAKVADRLCVVRSMTHTEAAHERGTHNMMTGYRPSPAIVYPSMGSLISHELGGLSELPPYVCVPELTSAFSGSGYLSSAFGPFTLGGDPARRSFKVRDLALPGGVDEERFAKRKRLLAGIDSTFTNAESADGIDAMKSFYERAYSMLASKEAVEAFNISAENDTTRDLYGRNSAGARMLMARRLIEAGVRFVSLSYGAWDTHTYHFRTTLRQLPPFDQAFGALIADLDERGMLEKTMVVVCSEFGRTPMVNAGAGRDHWPRVFSTILAGGGVKAGHIHGESDAIAAEPATAPVSPEDFACTVYRQLGIAPTKELMAPGNRPLEIVDGGSAVDEIIA